MSSTSFAFAILAGNDLDKIAHTLETIASQEAVAEIHTKIIISSERRTVERFHNFFLKQNRTNLSP